MLVLEVKNLVHGDFKVCEDPIVLNLKFFKLMESSELEGLKFASKSGLEMGLPSLGAAGLILRVV